MNGLVLVDLFHFVDQIVAEGGLDVGRHVCGFFVEYDNQPLRELPRTLRVVDSNGGDNQSRWERQLANELLVHFMELLINHLRRVLVLQRWPV